MRIKSLILYSLISSIFLFSLVSIWKVLSTLQGIDLENFNFAIILTLGIGISLINLFIGDKFHKAIKSIIFAILFTFVDGYLVQLMPIWYNIGIFGILIFYSFKIDKYNQKNLDLDHSSQTVVFEFLTLFGIVLFSFVILFPFYMMIVTSFKTQAALLINPLDFSINFAQDIKELFKSYFVIFDTYKFGRYILISTFVSVGTVIVTLIFAIPAAYAVARLNFFGKNFLSTSILIIYMFPAIVLVIPLYTVFSQLGLRNNVGGLLIVYTATTLPVAIYMLQGYFKSIPKELEEAAIMDKLNWFGIIIKIILPLSIPAISSVALYVFMIAWNEFLFAFMFLDDIKLFTLSRGIVSLNSSEVPRQHLMAGAVIATAPVLLLFLWFERFLVSGLTTGSVKG